MRKGPIFAVLSVVILCLGIGGYYLQTQKEVPQGPKIGVVRLQDVVESHPNFHSYDEQKKELLRLEAQRDKEEQLLQAKLGVEVGKSEEELKKIEANLTDSLQHELQSKIAVREAELNQELAQRQRALLEQYRKDYKVDPTEADIEIVNLQLSLSTEAKLQPIDDAQRQRWAQRKADKEARLAELLEARGAAIKGANHWKDIEAKVQQDMQPAYEAAHRTLATYASEVAKELGSKRDASMKTMMDSQQTVMAKVHQEGAQLWDAEWEQRLAQKRDEVQALHDAILEDIRVRVAVIARAKQLELVVVDHITDRTDMDITDEIISSYGQ